MQEQLAVLQNERDELDRECNRLHAEHGNALNEIELLKQQLVGESGESTSISNLLDLNEVRDQVLKNWRLVKKGESIDRIRQALDTFIKILES